VERLKSVQNSRDRVLAALALFANSEFAGTELETAAMLACTRNGRCFLNHADKSKQRIVFRRLFGTLQPDGGAAYWKTHAGRLLGATGKHGLSGDVIARVDDSEVVKIDHLVLDGNMFMRRLWHRDAKIVTGEDQAFAVIQQLVASNLIEGYSKVTLCFDLGGDLQKK
jgi:hypothetical protein